MHPKDLSIESFSYLLPPERIAQFPLQQRDESKLLVYKDGSITEKIFSSLPDLLPANSLLVFNDTKVIQARLLFKTSTEASIELFLLEPMEPFTEMRLAIFQHESCVWRCLVGNAKRWRDEVLLLRVKVGDKEISLTAELVKNEGETFLIRFNWQPQELSFAELLSSIGHVPLPPYMKRTDNAEDKSAYQTIYGQQDGSVAAPTAGLHFTERVFEQLKNKNIETDFVTLHVGAGTFKPVKSPTIGEHLMHAERIYVRRSTIEKLLKQINQAQIVSVGTTSLRTLESLYWFGCQLLLNAASDIEEMNITQWEPYERDESGGRVRGEFSSSFAPPPSSLESLNAILHWMIKKEKTEFTGYSQIMIAPGYKFKMVDVLVTNFHQPQSTLLLLIAAFIGDDWRKVYEYAMEHDFRFLSYGDSSLLFKKT